MRKSKAEHVGKVFNTTKWGSLIVTRYESATKVHVEFIDTGYTSVATISDIKKGCVRDRLLPSICGVGVIGDEVTVCDGIHTREYVTWTNMLTRCFYKNTHNKNSTYKDCTVSDTFRYLSKFSAWCIKQVGYNAIDENNEPFALDKDILVKGNKIYSETTCVFVPKEVNALLVKSGKNRGKCLLGVSYHSRVKKFSAQLGAGMTKLKHVGYFDTEIEAFYAYKEAKELYIKEVANKWKDQIDPRVYGALMNYQVEITD